MAIIATIAKAAIYQLAGQQSKRHEAKEAWCCRVDA
jgi:hypothetical protein